MGLANSKVKKSVSIDSSAWRDYILSKEVSRDAYVDHFKHVDVAGSRPSTSTGYSADGTSSSAATIGTQPEPIVQRVFVSRTEFSVANPFEDDGYLDLLSDRAGNPQQHGTDISDELNKAIGYESFEQRTRMNQRKRQSTWSPAGGGAGAGAATGGLGGVSAPAASAGYAMNEQAGFGGRGYGGLIGGFAIARESPSHTDASASALDASLSRSRAYRAGVDTTPLSDKENPMKMADDPPEHKRRTVADVLRRRRRSKPDATGEKRVHFEHNY